MATVADLQSLVLTSLDKEGSIADSRNLSSPGSALPLVDASVESQNELKAALASLESKEVRFSLSLPAQRLFLPLLFLPLSLEAMKPTLPLCR
jgi:hypothetical protein